MSATGNAHPKSPTAIAAKFAVLLETFSEALVVVDSTGQIVLASEGAEKLFG